MIVAVSGGSSTGKTLLLEELKTHGYKVIERKTARSILADWDTTLQEVYADPVRTMQFQEEIIRRKREDETIELATCCGHVVFTERTFADLFSFGILNLGKYSKLSDRIDEYYKACLNHNKLYGLVFYLKSGYFNPASDGTRVVNDHYVSVLNATTERYTKEMTHPAKLVILDTPNMKHRTDIILSMI